MSRHLYIAGVDRIADLERGSLRIEQALTYQIDTCSFSIKGEQPAEGEEVIVEDDKLGRLFAGIIVKVELARTFPDKSIKVWNVDCDDYTALLDRRLVVEAYENMSASDIFLDIVAKYCPGFTTNGVRSGAPVVESTGAEFEYKRPSDCFKWLCDYIGWHWQPDYYKDLHFFSAEELASPAPMTLVPGGKFRFGKHSIDTQGLRNRVYVRGGTMLSDPQVVQWKADGVARIWTLPWGPHEVSLTVGEVPMTVGVENLHDEEDFDYMMSFSEKYIRCSSQTSTPAEGTTMSLTARQDIPVITMVEDYASQAAISKVQGGDGIYEHVIVDDSLTTIQAAEAAGMADLREHANPRVKGSFETEVPGWVPGQIVPINLPDRGVIGEYLVQKVSLSPTWASPSIWTYRIDYGGRLLGIADFLKALVSAQQKKRNIEPSKSIQKYVYGQESLELKDELYSATRALPYVCGDPDAVCGMVVVEEGKIIIGWQEEIAEIDYRYDDPLSTQDFIAQDFIATAAMTGITLLRAFVRGGWLIDTKWGICRFTSGKPGEYISEPVVLPANEENWAYVGINLLEPLQEGVSYCLVGQGYPAIGQSGSAFWDYADPSTYTGGCQHTSDDSGVSWDSYPGVCCTFKIAIPIYG